MSKDQKTLKNVIESIRKYPLASKHLFSTNSVKQPTFGDVNKVLFLLIAWDIIYLKYEGVNNKKDLDVTIALAKITPLQTNLCLMDDSYWMKITTKEPLLDYTDN